MKSVLVIDMPESCGECPMHHSNPYSACKIKYYDLLPWYNVVNPNKKPDWCPLKPFPEEDNTEEYLSEWSRGYQGGWNDCINAIVGDKND